MVLPTPEEAVRFDLEGASMRSRLLDGSLNGEDRDRLLLRLDRGIDLGASAILQDAQLYVDPRAALPTPAGVRNAIKGSHANMRHHRGVPDFHIDRRDTLHWIEVGSVALPTFVHPTGSSVLIVTFHGVLNRDKYVLPRFEWVNSLRNLGHSILSFGDPTMDLELGLEGGWWLGTPLVDVVPQMATIVSRAMEELGARDLVLAGSSMGGFGALQLGAYFPEATVVAFNPQTDVRKYHVRRVTRVAMGSVFGADAPPHPPRVSVLERYASTGIVPSRIRYVANIGDRHHNEEHFEPFSAGLESIQPGRIIRTTRDDGPGHVKIPAPAFISTVLEELERLNASA
ncbi:hypothetical protein [Microbacterium sp. USHLN186]|uniref:hypothetical protein n=1 Tax=Microbacterium sp. USHLN186 TaxID=3081286 RepID=UPI003016DF81